MKRITKKIIQGLVTELLKSSLKRNEEKKKKKAEDKKAEDAAQDKYLANRSFAQYQNDKHLCLSCNY